MDIEDTYNNDNSNLGNTVFNTVPRGKRIRVFTKEWKSNGLG